MSNPDEAQWAEEFTEKYIVKSDLMMTLNRDYTFMMPIPEVIRIT